MKLTAVVSLAAAICTVSAGYSPSRTTCPSGNFARPADKISTLESLWLEARNKITQENLQTFLENAGLEDFDAAAFLSNTTSPVRIGLAFSGGGYRAMLSGAGQLAALDSRVDNAESNGLGGLLQSSSYVAGLSGGAWLVGTVASNGFPSIPEILAKNQIWDLTNTIINPGGFDILKAIVLYTDIFNDIFSKFVNGYPVSITDLWSRALSLQFFPLLLSYGALTHWSDLQTSGPFSTYEMPFPIIVADGREPGEVIISQNSTIFEFNPFEFGSWDPSLYQFTQTKYLGTTYRNGTPSGKCVVGYDNAGFIMGTSSSLFNVVVSTIATDVPALLRGIITKILNLVETVDLGVDVSLYAPNPFIGTKASTALVVNTAILDLVDGGEDSQNIPLYPLLQPDRGLDVIFAYDNSADTDDNWPDGASLVASYQRQFVTQGNGTLFPQVPTTSAFLAADMGQKPIFFGCNAKSLSPLLQEGVAANAIYDSPLLVYTANRKYSYSSNKATLKLQYTNAEKYSMIQNGFEVASRNNRTDDSDWAVCVGCAIIRREQERQGLEQSEQCKTCFDKYCWTDAVSTALSETVAGSNVNLAEFSMEAAATGTTTSSASTNTD